MGSLLDEESGDGFMALLTGKHQRSPSVVVLGLDDGSLVDESLDLLEVSFFTRSHQRGSS